MLRWIWSISECNWQSSPWLHHKPTPQNMCHTHSWPQQIKISRHYFTALLHRLTSRKGVHLFRYFLSRMRTPILLLFDHAYYAFCLQNAISTETGPQGVRIHVHLNRNAYYAGANNKRIGVRIQDLNINRCTPFLDVSLWTNNFIPQPTKLCSRKCMQESSSNSLESPVYIFLMFPHLT